jgi:hypothetical protein
MGALSPLSPARTQQFDLPAVGQQRFQQAPLGPPSHESTAKRAQDGVFEPLIGQLQPEQLLPVDARTHRLRGLSIAQILRELQHQHQREPPRGFRRLAALSPASVRFRQQYQLHGLIWSAERLSYSTLSRIGWT